MARIFNICFQHQECSYTALVAVMGKEEQSVRITTTADQIRIQLSSGSLVFAITDVLQRLYARQKEGDTDSTLYITPNISLQLL